MSYNFIREARSVSNSYSCRYDSLDGYTSNFQINGDVDGWDVYSKIYLYGCWDGIIFGTSYEESCYISRTNSFVPIDASKYFHVRIMMKITDNNPQKVVPTLTKGKIRWLRVSDSVWNSDKELEFNIINDNAWHLYDINMGPAQWWQGNINNLRIYPFIDGFQKDQFAIKFIKISSVDQYTCTNTNCSKYFYYEHPCPFTGARGSCSAAKSFDFYTTISGISDELIVNIDGYGDEVFKLGNNVNVTPIEMAKIISNKISTLNIGGYSYSQCVYNDLDKLEIISGTAGLDSSVSISGSAAEALGFFVDGVDKSTKVFGADPASGFDYASSKLLTALEINKLIDGKKTEIGYVHNPSQYMVEAGRRDFAEIGTGVFLSNLISQPDYYESLNNSGKTIIDFSHPIDNNGILNKIYIYGKTENLGKVKILRPKNNGQLEVIHSVDIVPESGSSMYTAFPMNYRIDCNLLVNKGDLIGIYNVDLYVGVSIDGRPKATIAQIEGDVSGVVTVDTIYSFGVEGLSLYARGDRRQTNTILDIDLGDRVNINEINIYGQETQDYFEYNLASCLDVNWAVNLFNGTHTHYGYYASTMLGWSETHTNIAVGVEALNDGIVTPDNGYAGDGLESQLGIHSYFYVTGDAEWLYGHDCDGRHEYCGNMVAQGTRGYKHDRIAFNLLFPNETKLKIHKSILYFKERYNFRNMALSYYLGSNNVTGNADDNHFKYIPQYNYVKLDGITYEPDENNLIVPYIFSNPTNSEPIYAHGDTGITNPDQVQGASMAQWNIIEHGFDPIDCYGFRVFTNYHESTKIMEMELYSKMYTTSSLVDNVFLSFSDYGDHWLTASFVDSSEKKINALVGAAPRYLKLELESSSLFEINEIELLVGDQVKLASCGDVELLEDAKCGVVNDSTSITIKNPYNKAFDLTVDLPKETTQSDDVIFWNKLGSKEEMLHSEIGPACILFKAKDFEIKNDNKQIAINTHGFGLKNLVDGKKAYYSYDDNPLWVYYDTLSSGTSLDKAAENANYLKSVIPITPVSSKYWKLGMTGTSVSAAHVRTFFEDVEVDMSNFYFGVEPGVNISPMRDIDSGDLVDLSWTEYHTHPLDDIDISENKIELIAWDPNFNDTIEYGGYALSNIIPGGVDNFTFDISFMLYRLSTNKMGAFDITFFDNTDAEIIRVYVSDSWAGSYNVVIGLLDKGVSKIGTYNYITTMNNDGINTNQIHLSRSGNNLILYVDDVLKYNGVFSTETISYIRVRFYKYSTYTPPDRMFVYFGGDLFIELNNNDPIDSIELIHSGDIPERVEAYTSVDGINYSLIENGIVPSPLNHTFYNYLAIDLEKRHDLDIIRNYGNATDKLWLSADIDYVDYSNSETTDVDNVVWDNSDKNDARWVRIGMLSGDGITRCIRKLGIYPNIKTAVCHSGGYNCEWQPLGTMLTDYTTSQNVAYGATVTGTNNYWSNYFPTNAVDGITTDYHEEACWGFTKVGSVDPYIEIDFGDSYLIHLIKLFHGYDPNDNNYMNKNYSFSVSPTISGIFTEVLSITNNSEHYREHHFDPVYARRARLVITDYDTIHQLKWNEATGVYEEFSGSFLREIEVYTYAGDKYIDSETWPVVAIDLQDQFNVGSHELVNKNPNDPTTDWDNSEEFFLYSDNLFDDPQKVAFSVAGDYKIQYSVIKSSGDMRGSFEYVFDREIYFDAGRYDVEWDAYEAGTEDEVSIRLDGPEQLDIYVNLAAGGWQHQKGVVDIPVSGFYDVKGIQHISSDEQWGVRNPVFYRPVGLRKWVAVTRDTAENYAYDNDSAKYGKDYLDLIQIYGTDEYYPTEYYWWWDSTLSSLENDYLTVLNSYRSLKINYPTSSGSDVINFIEGDNFGQDVNFEAKDFFNFYWWVSDVNKLDVDYGDVSFGIINSSNPVYYIWNINKLNLITGWNNINLKFEDADYVYPAYSEFDAMKNFLKEDLDFRNNNRNFSSIRLRYRGKSESFSMNIEGFKIRRNLFDEDVKFNKGICLTGNDWLEIPLSNITLERGTVEFWLKMYSDTYGRNIFNDIRSRVLFSIVNNNNDIISLGIKSGKWFELNSGHMRYNLNIFTIDAFDLPESAILNIDDVVHLAVVWSNSGTDMDNDDTMRLYLNNELLCTSKKAWDVLDTKSVIFKFGGAISQLSLNQDAYGGGIFDNVKIYNYCKTYFDIVNEGVEKVIAHTPNEFLEISKDNINFYGLGSNNLPLVFEQVPPGGSEQIFVRANKSEYFKQSSGTTASLIIDWLTTV